MKLLSFTSLARFMGLVLIFQSNLSYPGLASEQDGHRILRSTRALNMPLATFTVMNLNESGPGSLRQAIVDSNAIAGADTINFDPLVTGTIPLTNGELLITDELTISGPSAGVLTVSGNLTSRVFNIALGVTVSISGLSVKNGIDEFDGGGGIRNAGRLSITNCTISDNSAFRGGGIFNESLTLTVTNSTVSGNVASFGGGGIFNVTGSATITTSTVAGNSASVGGGIANGFSTMTVTNSTVASNSATGDGGGILNDGSRLMIKGSTISDNRAGPQLGRGGGVVNLLGSNLAITDSTISGNSAREGGGVSNDRSSLTISNSTISGNSGFAGSGVFNLFDTTLAITNCTISDNSGVLGGGLYISGGMVSIANSTITGNSVTGPLSRGGGIFNGAGNTVTVKNSIVAINSGGDCFNSSGLIIGLGENFSTDASCSTFTQVTAAQLNLGPLSNNGGPTQTHALLPGSIALDAVTDCTDISGNPVVADQRAVSRPLDGDGDGLTRCDAGAYEAPAFLPFDLCLQDDSNGSMLKIKSTTGDYQFSNCSGSIITGAGSVTARGGVVTLQHYASDRRLIAKIDRSARQGTASLQLFVPRTNFTIVDRNLSNSTCVCIAR